MREPVLAHRLILTPEAELNQRRAGDVVARRARPSVPVPVPTPPAPGGVVRLTRRGAGVLAVAAVLRTPPAQCSGYPLFRALAGAALGARWRSPW